MKVVSIVKDIKGAPLPNTLSYVVDDQIPPIELISSVFGLITDGKGNILLVRNKRRGWGVPGGHSEKGEGLEQALHREVKEETDCEIEIIKPFGYQQIDSQGVKPDDYKYPHPKGYVEFFLAKLKVMNKFDESSVWREETFERKLISFKELEQVEEFKGKLPFYTEGIEQLIKLGN